MVGMDLTTHTENIAVWALSTEQLLKRETEFSVHSQRIRAQRSVFTKLLPDQECQTNHPNLRRERS